MDRSSPEANSLVGVRAAVVNWRDLDHSQAGGAEHYAWHFARALRERGAQVDFVTARDAGQSRRDERDGIRILRAGGQFTFYLWAAFYLVTRRSVLDVVVDPECGIPVFSPLFVRRSTPVVLIVHHIHQRQFAEYFPGPLAKLGQFLEAWLMPRVYRRARTLAVSTSTASDMRSELGWTGEIELLHNGSTLPEVADPAGTPHHLNRLVVLGRLVPHKRVDWVLEVLAALRGEGIDLTLDVMGRGPEEEPLRERAAALGIADAVRIHGFVADADKAAILGEAGLHLCASDNEGWGQVVIEVAAHGVPTVARDVAGLRDSIVDAQTGWLASPGDRSPSGLTNRESRASDVRTVDAAKEQIRALTDCVRSALGVLADPVQAARIRSACVDHAGHYDWKVMRADAAAIVSEELRRTGV